MKIIIEKKEVALDLPEKQVTMNQVIDEVETFLMEVGKVPTSLSLNGSDWTQEDLETRIEEVLKDEDTLEFGVQSIFEFIEANLDGAATANGELMRDITTFAKEIHTSEKTIAPDTLVEEISHFFEFWWRLRGLLPDEFKALKFAEKDFDTTMGDLQKLFEEIVEGMQNQDFVLAADLLQYEVMPSIEAIDKTIPTLKNTLQERAAQN